MADWRINEKYRKPRRAKGTPFYTQRNYYACGVLAFGAISWGLYELWPATRKLKKSQLEGELLKLPEGLETKIKHIQLGRTNPVLDELLSKARDRETEKYEDKSEPTTWLGKVLQSSPDL